LKYLNSQFKLNEYESIAAITTEERIHKWSWRSKCISAILSPYQQ